MKPSLKKDPKGLSELQKLEEKLSMENIVLFRKIAMQELENEEKLKAKKKEKEKKEKREKNVFLKLKEYGAYDFQTGQCLNRFVPSYENNNPYESLQVITDGEGTRLLWSDAGDGSWSYRVRIVDDTIYLTGRRRISGGAWQPWDSWIRIVDWNGSLLFTVSKEGTYRVYEALAR